jgi:hypothetical protein
MARFEGYPKDDIKELRGEMWGLSYRAQLIEWWIIWHSNRVRTPLWPERFLLRRYGAV